MNQDSIMCEYCIGRKRKIVPAILFINFINDGGTLQFGPAALCEECSKALVQTQDLKITREEYIIESIMNS